MGPNTSTPPVTASTGRPQPLACDEYAIPRSASVAYLSSFLEAPETKAQHAIDTAGLLVCHEKRTSVLFRHSGWMPDRKRIAEALARTDQPVARREAYRDCGDQAFVLRNVEDPSRYRVAGSCCKDRFCLPCATERSTLIAANVIDLTTDMELRFLTLTIKTNDEPLAEQLDKLYRSFQALRRRVVWTKAVTGGAAFLELKRSSKSDRWHPHLHCLLAGRWVDRKELKRAWYAITTDSFVIDIRPVHNTEHAARYVTKYASKPFNASFVRRPDLLDEAIVALKGRKLAVTFGNWRGLLMTARPPDGTWELVAPLNSIIERAAAGNIECRAIMGCLSDMDMSPIYERAPPIEPIPPRPRLTANQLNFFGTWDANGSFVFRLP